MWWAPPADPTPVILPPISTACIAILTTLVLLFGIWPQPIWALLQ